MFIFNVLGSCNFKWSRVAETARPTTTARSIGRSVFGGMVRINFLASRNIHGTFKQTWFALLVKTTLSLRHGGIDLTRRIRVPACEMILAVLIMRCTPTIHELIVLTLPPRHRCPLDRLPASRLLLSRSGLERGRLRALAHLRRADRL
jgi:hypothetical protein